MSNCSPLITLNLLKKLNEVMGNEWVIFTYSVISSIRPNASLNSFIMFGFPFRIWNSSAPFTTVMPRKLCASDM